MKNYITINKDNSIKIPKIMYKTIDFKEVTNKKYLIEVQGYGLFGIYNTKVQAEKRAEMITQKNDLSCYITEIEQEVNNDKV